MKLLRRCSKFIDRRFITVIQIKLASIQILVATLFFGSGVVPSAALTNGILSSHTTTMTTSFLDLTGSSREEEEKETQTEEEVELKMVVHLAPESKPSIRFGPANPRGQGYQGRGRGFGRLQLFRCYPDGDRKRKKDQFASLVSHQVQQQGFQRIPRAVPVKVEAWFFSQMTK